MEEGEGGGLLIEWMSGLVDEAKVEVKVKVKVEVEVASRASATGGEIVSGIGGL